MSALRSKLNRAICAHLINKGIGSVDTIIPANTRKAKGFPNATVKSVIAIEDLEQIGCERITVEISVKGTATQEADEPNPAIARKQFDAFVESIWNALRQTDNGFNLNATASDITDAGRALAVPIDGTDDAILFADNDADMPAFTINAWFSRGTGDGEPDDASFAWCELLMFEAVCCGKNVD